MAINDILGEARRFFVDVSQYFAAGQQVSKCEKVVEKLEKKIKSCQEKLDDAKAGASGQTAQYSSCPGSAQGELKTEYDAKVDAWDKKQAGESFGGGCSEVLEEPGSGRKTASGYDGG